MSKSLLSFLPLPLPHSSTPVNQRASQSVCLSANPHSKSLSSTNGFCYLTHSPAFVLPLSLLYLAVSVGMKRITLMVLVCHSTALPYPPMALSMLISVAGDKSLLSVCGILFL